LSAWILALADSCVVLGAKIALIFWTLANFVYGPN
jgi:hypothetical protein